MSIPDFIMKNRDMLFKHGKEFRHIFGVSLNQYLDPIYGFDVIRFDALIKVPDGISTSDFLRKTYGDASHSMISEMLGPGQKKEKKRRLNVAALKKRRVQ